MWRCVEREDVEVGWEGGCGGVLGGRMWRCVGKGGCGGVLVRRMWRCVGQEDVEVCGEGERWMKGGQVSSAMLETQWIVSLQWPISCC